MTTDEIEAYIGRHSADMTCVQISEHCGITTKEFRAIYDRIYTRCFPPERVLVRNSTVLQALTDEWQSRDDLSQKIGIETDALNNHLRKLRIAGKAERRLRGETNQVMYRRILV